MGGLTKESRRSIRQTRRQALSSATVRAGQRRLRPGLWGYVRQSSLPTLLTAPIVYSLIVPFALLHVWVDVFQAICFRAWGIQRVRRRSYLVIDRHKLAYLNGIERLHCLLCSYANGVIAYVREVAARTEQYWCPIRHARRPRHPHDRYEGYAAYGDAHAYRRNLSILRGELKR